MLNGKRIYVRSCMQCVMEVAYLTYYKTRIHAFEQDLSIIYRMLMGEETVQSGYLNTKYIQVQRKRLNKWVGLVEVGGEINIVALQGYNNTDDRLSV